MGLGGNDTLWGQTGADQMIGGTGNDTYHVETAGDTVIESANEGTDTVHTYIDYTLTANVENLEMDFAGNLAGYGNSLNNRITGNSNNNTIDGGAGNDTMIGGLGQRWLLRRFKLRRDRRERQRRHRRRLCQHELSARRQYRIPVPAGHWQHQRLRQRANTTSKAIAATTSSMAARASDTMVGGEGNDIYFVDSSFDQIVENANEGTDAVYASVNYQLGANIEYLYLQGAANINGYGNARITTSGQ